MSFFATVEQYKNFSFADFFNQIDDAQVHKVLQKETLTPTDFLTLLSPVAAQHLEAMAQKAHQLTVQHFGRTIQLFIPLYISNYCANQCAYCGFNRKNKIVRRTLSLAEIEREAQAIARTGMQHVLFLTGEAQQLTPMDYLLATTRCLKKYFASVAIELYPLDVDEYVQLVQAGVDSMTLFQECYDQEIYKKVHLAGKKMDYHYRLNAPDRAAKAGVRAVNIGALLGLAEPRQEFFFTAMHARYLEDTFLTTEVSVSLPRFNECESDFTPDYLVDDKTFVQFLAALRLFLPRVGITISTRENAQFRDQLLPLGVTRYSAGSRTGVGGYADSAEESTPQFEITDNREVVEVASAISHLGYQAVFKDWDAI
jgi:2-iminoacetate synthase